jgi:hypothetical protein
MSKLEKLLSAFINSPYPTWQETESLLVKLGYIKQEGSGSRCKFIHKTKKSVIDLHKPHPGNAIKSYLKKQILLELTSQELI